MKICPQISYEFAVKLQRHSEHGLLMYVLSAAVLMTWMTE